MKVIRGIVREEQVNKVVEALEAAGAPGLTVMKVQGRGRNSPVGVYRGLPVRSLRPMCAIDVIAADGDAEAIVGVMLDHAHTGHSGDGHVFVFGLEETYAVRTRWPRVA